MEKSLIGVVIGIVLLVTFGIFFPLGCVDVRPTDVGVMVDKLANKVDNEPLTVGYHIYNRWTKDIIQYTVASRSYPGNAKDSEKSDEYTLELKTSDGQNVNVDLTLIYSLKAKEVPVLHQTVGVRYEDEILLPQMRSEARLAFGGYTAENIYQGKVREEIQKEILQKMTNNLAKYPAIVLSDVLVRHLSFSKEFESAIERKKLAAQSVEINKNLALAEEEKAKQVEAEARGQKLKVIQEAEGIGQAAEAKARGEAAAAKVRADAEKYKLVAEAEGNLAKYKAEAEGKRLAAEALKGSGGQNVVALEFAKNIPDKMRIFGVPMGQNSTSFMDMGMLKGMFNMNAVDGVEGK